MIFDAIIISITLMLAVKGFLNGVVKEIAGLLGIIGGFFIASRYYHEAGVYINENLITIKNTSAIDLVGFISVFLLVWIFCIFLGFLFNHLLRVSALGFVDKFFGFLVGGLKFFLMISIIIAFLYRIEFLRNYISKFTKESQVFPIALKIGDEIMKLSPQKISNVEKNLKEKFSENIENKLKAPKNIEKNLFKNVTIPKDINISTTK